MESNFVFKKCACSVHRYPGFDDCYSAGLRFSFRGVCSVFCIVAKVSVSVLFVIAVFGV